MPSAVIRHTSRSASRQRPESQLSARLARARRAEGAPGGDGGASAIDIPIVIGGREIRTGRTAQAVMPHDHRHVLADWHAAEPEHVQQAIAAAADARREWAQLAPARTARRCSCAPPSC